MLGLDCLTYRHFENIAKSLSTNWRSYAIFNLDIFSKTGFPIRLNSNLELRALFDTLHEDRFDILMSELNGLSDDDLEVYLKALRESVEMQLGLFPDLDPIVPYESMLYAFQSYDTVKRLKPDLKSILEIGSGSGDTAFFFKTNEQLENYSSIEVCESFYILQNYVNNHCFKDGFMQHVPISVNYNEVSLHNSFAKKQYEESNNASDITYAKTNDHTINYRKEKRAFQFPWWKLEDLKKSDNKFDVIMSNNNLLEFTKGSLFYYMELIKAKLADDGYFVVLGSGYCKDNQELFNLQKLIADTGFYPVAHLQGDTTGRNLEAISNFVRPLDEIAFAPYSDITKSFIRDNMDGVLKNKKIVIVDDNADKLQEELSFTFVSSENFKTEFSHIKNLVLMSNNPDLRNKFISLATPIGVEVFVFDCAQVSKKFNLWNSVFVKNGHPMHRDVEDMIVFTNYNHRSDDYECYTNNAFFSRKINKRYAKDQIRLELIDRINNV